MRYRYNGDPGRYYLTLNTQVTPGDLHEWDEAPPDGLWSPAPEQAPKKKAAPAGDAPKEA